MGVADSFLSPVAGKLGEVAVAHLMPSAVTNEIGQIVREEVGSLTGTAEQRERVLALRRHSIDLAELDVNAARAEVAAKTRGVWTDRAVCLGIGTVLGYGIACYMMRRKSG